jgi:hypothetical protein
MKVIHPAVRLVSALERLWLTNTHTELDPNQIAFDRAKLIVTSLVQAGVLEGIIGEDMTPYHDVSFNGG